VVLDGGARDDLIIPSVLPQHHRHSSVSTHRSNHFANSFRPADVTNLLAILANGTLAPELRRSASEQLLALAADEELREVMLQEVGQGDRFYGARLRQRGAGR
jgi:rotatin